MKNISKQFSSTTRLGTILLLLVFVISIGYSQSPIKNSFVGAIKADVETIMLASKSLDQYLSNDKENNNSSSYYTWVVAEFGSVSEANLIWNRLRANTHQHFKSNNKANVAANELKNFYLEISGIVRTEELSGDNPGPTFCYDRFIEDSYLALSESILAGSVYSGIAEGTESHILAWVKANANFDNCLEINY